MSSICTWINPFCVSFFKWLIWALFNSSLPSLSPQLRHQSADQATVFLAWFSCLNVLPEIASDTACGKCNVGPLFWPQNSLRPKVPCDWLLSSFSSVASAGQASKQVVWTNTSVNGTRTTLYTKASPRLIYPRLEKCQVVESLAAREKSPSQKYLPIPWPAFWPKTPRQSDWDNKHALPHSHLCRGDRMNSR